MPEPEVPLKDPCPCGSGRKYKNCCWRRMKREHAAFRAAVKKTREDVHDLVREEYEERLYDLVVQILGPLRMRQGPERADEIVGEVGNLLLPFMADVLVADVRQDGQRSLIEEYLARRADALPEGVLEYLESWRNANVSLYEVREVAQHSHVVLKDLLSNRLHTVSDKFLSETVTAWETLFARIACADGHCFVTGPVLPVYRQLLGPVRRGLEEYRSEYGNRSLSWKRLLKRDWWVIPEIWMELVEETLADPEPEMVNSDGERVESVRVTYYLTPGTGMMAAALLEKIPEIRAEEDGSLVWLEPREGAPMDNILVAHIARPDESTLVLSTNSRPREERVSLAIDRFLDPMIEDVDVEYGTFDPSEMAPSSGISADDLSPEELADVKRQVLHKLYASWPDESIPALDGLTPRQAVKNGKGCRRVIELLKTLELRHEMAGECFDFTWLWEELGLKRP